MLKFVVRVYSLQRNERHSNCRQGILYRYQIHILLGMRFFGLAADPIHGVAAALFISLTEIILLDQHHFRLWNEWPVVEDIV
jgi:hypothetical protein